MQASFSMQNLKSTGNCLMILILNYALIYILSKTIARCIPEGLNSSDYEVISLLSPENPCRVYDLTNVTENCDLELNPKGCLDLIETEKCAKCENGFVYSPNNTFQETVVSR